MLPTDMFKTQTEMTGEELSLSKQNCKIWKRSLLIMGRYQCKESRIMKKQVNMTQLKETSKHPKPDLKE